MTNEEHELITAMFSQVYEGFQALFDALKSRGLWTGDDPQAFVAAVHADKQKTFQIMQRTLKTYLQFAQKLGVQTGIQGPTI